MRINPTRITRRQAIGCPDCGAACFSEIITGPSHATRYQVECTACRFSERIDIDASGNATPATDKPIGKKARPGQKRKALGDSESTSGLVRKRCVVPGCIWPQCEGGLCDTHRACWRAAGRPADTEAWAQARGEQEKTDRAKTKTKK